MIAYKAEHHIEKPDEEGSERRHIAAIVIVFRQSAGLPKSVASTDTEFHRPAAAVTVVCRLIAAG